MAASSLLHQAKSWLMLSVKKEQELAMWCRTPGPEVDGLLPASNSLLCLVHCCQVTWQPCKKHWMRFWAIMQASLDIQKRPALSFFLSFFLPFLCLLVFDMAGSCLTHWQEQCVPTSLITKIVPSLLWIAHQTAAAGAAGSASIISPQGFEGCWRLLVDCWQTTIVWPPLPTPDHKLLLSEIPDSSCFVLVTPSSSSCWNPPFDNSLFLLQQKWQWATMLMNQTMSTTTTLATATRQTNELQQQGRLCSTAAMFVAELLLMLVGTSSITFDSSGNQNRLHQTSLRSGGEEWKKQTWRQKASSWVLAGRWQPGALMSLNVTQMLENCPHQIPSSGFFALLARCGQFSVCAKKVSIESGQWMCAVRKHFWMWRHICAKQCGNFTHVACCQGSIPSMHGQRANDCLKF
jgi:hypothetical protein